MSKQLLIVGEPACVPAAQSIFKGAIEVVAYSDDLDVTGRKIVYWPTAPGTESHGKAQKLATVAEEVKVLVTGDKPSGWNAIAALNEGWDTKKFIEWARDRLIMVIAVSNDPLDTAPTESQQAIVDRLGLAKSTNGVPVCNAANVVKYMNRCGDFTNRIWFDEFTNQVCADQGGWAHIRTLQLMVKLQSELGLHRLTSQNVDDAVEMYANENRRHSVRYWLHGLKWDGKKRIGTFFPDYCGATPTASHFAFSSNFWIMLAHRIYEPGCQADYMIILEGDQGIGKTRAFRTIGGDWYAEVGITADSEDFERQLQGKILVEIAELHSFSKSEQSRVKQIITKRIDRYREKYGKVAVDHPRQGLLVGTTNETEWIKDQTGGRRFWPVRCGAIDTNAILRDRDQLFAEAVLRYREGDPGYLVPVDEVKLLQEERREVEPWEELLKEKTMLLGRVTTVEAMALLGIPNERMDNRLSKRVSQALRRLGFASKPFRVEGELKRYWYKNGSTPENLPLS